MGLGGVAVHLPIDLLIPLIAASGHDMDTHMVIAVNMYDELEKKGDRFDYVSLARMIGVPIIPTIGKTGFGIDSLLKKIIEVYEAKNR